MVSPTWRQPQAATPAGSSAHARDAPRRPPSGDRFDNLAVYTLRLRPGGQADRVWTVDLDAEQCEAFWQNNPGTPSKDFS
jgi:hypothetical protein